MRFSGIIRAESSANTIYVLNLFTEVRTVMYKLLKNFGLLIAVVLFSYVGINAQIVKGAKKVVEKAKDVTVDAAKKTAEVTEDVADKTKDATVEAAEKTADVTKDVADKTVDGAKAAGSGAKKVGGYVVETSGDVAEKAVEGGKFFVHTTWDGTKWVSKKVWYPTKNAAAKTVKVVN